MNVRILALLPAMVFAGSLLTGCSPVYRIDYEYQLPKTATGKSCVRQCETRRQQCASQCSQAFKSCALKAETKARELMPKLTASWETAYRSWLDDRNWYLWRRDRWHWRRERYVDRCMNDGESRSSCRSAFSRHYGYEPYFLESAPEQPEYSKVYASIVDKSCDKSCDCDKSYNHCYSNCGGTVTPQKICVKNCRSQ